jgi:bis(5'-nucleosyl)-tetraphosphatase (symmetrical)
MQRIFVGDVQGCAEELEEILTRARREHGTAFELWSVGDLVNRGPASLRALALVRELAEQGRACCVLGNHELHLLALWLGARTPGAGDTLVEVLERSDASDWVAWIRRWPLAIGGELGRTPFALVHAASHPRWSLAELLERVKEPERILASAGPEALRRFLGEGEPSSARDVLGRIVSCRSVTAGGGWSSEEPGAGRVAWHAPWSRAAHGFGVVYGHWATQGLHVAPKLRGLDTGCVHHGRWRDTALTAWLPDERRADPFALPDERFWAVPAKRRYFEHA